MKPTWRDGITVHTLADQFPMMSDSELKELADDIEKHGLKDSVLFAKIDGKRVLVDGRNRYAACHMIGRTPASSEVVYSGAALDAFILSKNVHRRHLTPAQRQERLDAVIIANPTASDRVTGEKAGVDKNTAARRRKKIAGSTGAPHQSKTVGKDGRARTTTPKKPAKKKPAAAPTHPVPAGNGLSATSSTTSTAEESAEQRKAEVSEGNTVAVDEIKACCSRVLPQLDEIDTAEVRRHFDLVCRQAATQRAKPTIGSRYATHQTAKDLKHA